MGILYILLGAAFGAIITYLRLQNNTPADNEELSKLAENVRSLDLLIKTREEKNRRFENELKSTKEVFNTSEGEVQKLKAEVATLQGQLIESTNKTPVAEPIVQIEPPVENRNDEIPELERQIEALTVEKSELESNNASLKEENLQIAKKVENLENDCK